MRFGEHEATFRFYEELNDFLKEEAKGKDIRYCFSGCPAIKDPIEAIGIPHTEVELILINGASVGFDHRLRDGDRVAVYPMFESFDVPSIIKLRKEPLRDPTFICDVHLGKLARFLRIAGFDTFYRNDLEDPEIVRISAETGRIVLTRDRRLLYRKAVTHGCFIRSDDPDRQMQEVLRRFDLAGRIGLMTRCPACNGELEAVPKADILDRLEPLTRKYYDSFFRCVHCDQVYWQGSHYEQFAERFRIWQDRSGQILPPI